VGSFICIQLGCSGAQQARRPADTVGRTQRRIPGHVLRPWLGRLPCGYAASILQTTMGATQSCVDAS
jgi:hypothetical protein